MYLPASGHKNVHISNVSVHLASGIHIITLDAYIGPMNKTTFVINWSLVNLKEKEFTHAEVIVLGMPMLLDSAV